MIINTDAIRPDMEDWDPASALTIVRDKDPLTGNPPKNEAKKSHIPFIAKREMK